jgi:hypothetical protein
MTAHRGDGRVIPLTDPATVRYRTCFGRAERDTVDSVYRAGA